MALINASYFNGELNIPDTDKPTVLSVLNQFIDKYEPKLLMQIFGFTFYKDFTQGLQQNSVAQKWVDLLMGVDYTMLNSQPNRWRGIVEGFADVDSAIKGSGDGNKQSFIAGYVYYWYMRNNSTMTTSGGEKHSEAENATRANPSLKMSRAWNESVHWICEINDYLNASKLVYDTWNPAFRKPLRTINAFSI